MKKSSGKKVAVIGAGMGGLCAAVLLAKRGWKPTVFEQNYLPGGCSSSYYRKGFIFETGATTLVGLDKGMPLQVVMDEAGVEFDWLPLEVPMQVHLPDGQIATRYQPFEQWLAEAERVFGTKGQADFWQTCYRLSQTVWDTSTRQRFFPPSKLSDLIQVAKSVSIPQIKALPMSLVSVEQLLKRHGLYKNELFVKFVDEQLWITAQNHHKEVNALFGAAALCYTNSTNAYVPGGLLQMAQAFVKRIEELGGEVRLREEVIRFEWSPDGFEIHSQTKGSEVGGEQFDQIVFGIPTNNIVSLFGPRMLSKLQKPLGKRLTPLKKLNGAFTMGIGLNPSLDIPQSVLHHQVHLEEPLPGLKSGSIFLSLSHPSDAKRQPNGGRVASISTHVHDVSNFGKNDSRILDKQAISEKIIGQLEEKGLLRASDIVYQHSSGPNEWKDWTLRAGGFVGGYPQQMGIKPWAMPDARLGQGLYQCGDSVYPGQGIPGVALSGLIAATKLISDNS